MSVSCELKKYENSQEERVLRQTLKGIELNFANLVIESCNVLKPVSFTNADVVLQPVSEEFANRNLSMLSRHDIDYDYTIVKYDQLFKKELINDVVTHGIKNLKDEHKPAFLAILNFLREGTYHEEALSTYKGVVDEVRITALMVQHLFCHLIPGNEYVMDNGSKFKDVQKYCPCAKNDCRKALKIGCTALGSPETWHGYVDIILNQKISVSILEKLSTSEDDDMEENISSLDDDREEEEDPSKPKHLDSEDGDTEKEEGPSNPKRLHLSSSGSSTCSTSNLAGRETNA